MSRDIEQDEEEHSRSSIEKIADFFSHLAFGESDAEVDSKETTSSENLEQSSEDMSTSEHNNEHAQESRDVNNDAHDATVEHIDSGDSVSSTSSEEEVMQKTSSYFIDPDKADSSELELVTLVSS